MKYFTPNPFFLSFGIIPLASMIGCDWSWSLSMNYFTAVPFSSILAQWKGAFPDHGGSMPYGVGLYLWGISHLEQFLPQGWGINTFKCYHSWKETDIPSRMPLLLSSNVGTGNRMSTILDSDPVLGEIVRRLVEAYQPERIYLFGSKARGDASPDSDYDLMVVVPNDAPTERRQSRLAYEQL